MACYEFYLTDSLEKVFPGQRAAAITEPYFTGFRNEKISFQLVYTASGRRQGTPVQAFCISVQGAAARLRRVELLPSDFPCYAARDDNYLTCMPGMFPDALRDFDGRVVPIPGQMRSVWITVDLSGMEPGVHELTVKAEAEERTVGYNGAVHDGRDGARWNFEQKVKVKVLPSLLPAQKLIHTEWFHGDCLAHYYQVPVFSERYWQIAENYIRFAAKDCGINMLLTPVFTPPLDTAAGGERLTVQLMEVYREKDGYRFGFERLGRWCGLCKRHGIEYLEIPHLFTQWGAKATPKIMAVENGEEKRIFGWDVEAGAPEYRKFLEAFLPALTSYLEKEGYGRDRLCFHISDEPGEEQLESYLAAKKQAEDLLKGYLVVDALSSYEFYRKGIVEHPVPANDHIQPFIDHGVPGLWVYYCCVQGVDVPNRFYAMPSARNRIMGVLLYLYRIEGFLHWGYNFYNSQYSLEPVDPYRITHAGYAFPSGDPYLVYPGEDGAPVSSVRNEVQMEAFYDLRALCLLESLTDRETVERIIYEGVEEKITFRNYPQEKEYLLRLRRRVNEEIESRG